MCWCVCLCVFVCVCANVWVMEEVMVFCLFSNSLGCFFNSMYYTILYSQVECCLLFSCYRSATFVCVIHHTGDSGAERT
jgi:hypothetical protein